MLKDGFGKEDKPVVATAREVMPGNERGAGKLSKLMSYIHQAKAFKENDLSATELQPVQVPGTKGYRKKIK